MAPFDIERVRAETKGCANVIHFNNAGASLMPDPVIETVMAHLDLERMFGGYEALQQRSAQCEGYYDAFARLLNCDVSEIAYVENATRAWDMAFYSIPFERGDRVITTKTEYVSNYLALLQMEKRKGITIDVVPDDDSGQPSLPVLESMLNDRVKLIAVTHVPTQSGLINPVVEIGRLARGRGILYLLDACQSLGQMPIDVQAIGCDMLSATGRKFLRGPRGTGVLYVKRALAERLEPPFVDLKSAAWVDADKYELRPDARRFENWERYAAGQLGLARAADYAMELGLEATWSRVQMLASYLRDQLNQVSGVAVRDRGRQLCGIVTFTKEGEAAESINKRLLRYHINTDVSRFENARLDLGERDLGAVVRASVHYFNTEEEIDRFCQVLND